MNQPPEDQDVAARRAFEETQPLVAVHVLSEHVFCPRAAMLALESGDDDGSEEPMLGPRLDWAGDYDEQRFAEELNQHRDTRRYWLFWLALSCLLVLALWTFVHPGSALAACVAPIFCLAMIIKSLLRSIDLVRQRALLRRAPEIEFDVNAAEIRWVNWWSLRKAGFDCLRPDRMYDRQLRLVGRPWRELVKGSNVRIPVIYKRLGEVKCRPQHLVRIAAYCRLIQACEGASAPFGVIVFAGSYNVLVIPCTEERRTAMLQALDEARWYMNVLQTRNMEPGKPAPEVCSGCHWGKPRQHSDESVTTLRGRRIRARRTHATNGREYHSTCGDRFDWVPPHHDAVQLGIAGE